MKQNFSFIYKLLLLAGDTLALLVSFSLAYILRVTLDPRPVAQPVDSQTYLMFIVTLLPLWLGAFSLLGLYARRNYERRPTEASRLVAGALTGVLLMVAFDFFSNEIIFPAKLIPIYAALISFFVLWTFRTLLRALRLYLYAHGYGTVKVLLVGNSQATYYLGKYLSDNQHSGLVVSGIIAAKQHIYEDFANKQFRSLGVAIDETNPDAIIQTDTDGLQSSHREPS